MGAPKRRRSGAKHGDKLTAKSVKLRKTGKPGGHDRRIGKPRKSEEKKHLLSAAEPGKLQEEHLDERFESQRAELVVNTMPTVYDSLLKKLGSRNINVADALRRRQREEQGKTDTDEDEDEDGDVDKDSDLESIDELEELDDDDDEEDDGDDDDDDDDDGDGDDRMSPRSDLVGEDANHVEQSEEAEEDDYDAMSDTDEEATSVANDQSFSEASSGISNFDNHLSYRLTSSEVDSLLERKWKYTWKVPVVDMSNCQWRGTGECFIKDLEADSFFGLKLRIYNHWLESYKASGSSEFQQSKQRSVFSICNSYYDIMHHNKKPFYLKGSQEDSNIMDAYLVHSLNHVFKSKDLMIKNEKKLAKSEESMASKSVDDDVFRDRGFTRPKVLILLPLAGIMRRVVKRLLHLTPTKLKATVENLERFCEEYDSGRTESKDEDDDLEIPKSRNSGKPSDFQALFGRGNDDSDQFMIGIKYTNRGIKLYGDFYTSDIIIASPLALITKIGETEVNKEKDVDYLSSIEILIIDHADVMLMQNWSHVNTVVEQLNKLPSKQHGTDVMRLRPWYLDGQARFYRQTILLGSHTNPEMNAMFNQRCLNYRGKVKLECTYKGVLPKILIQARQIYERFDIESIVEADNARMKYFCEKVFPKINDSVQNGVMIFVNSYFEFVRLRNYLKSQSASFCLFGEYIKRNEISRVRGEFFKGEKKIMLYTERAHFYYRYKIRGVKNLIMYSLPERKEFYPEIVNLLEESDSMNCRVLFSRLDQLRLERIVGSSAAKRMIDSDKGVFVFA